MEISNEEIRQSISPYNFLDNLKIDWKKII